MKKLYVAGNTGSGKTAFALGLALNWKEKGRSVGYFKPVSYVDWPACRQDDPDAVLFKTVLGLEESIDELVPYHAAPSYLTGLSRDEDHLDRLRSLFEAVARSHDVMLIGGSGNSFWMGSVGLDAASVSLALGSPLIYMVRADDDFSIDRAVCMCNYFRSRGVRLLGIVFNAIARPILGKTEAVYKPVFENQGIRVWGTIPRHSELDFPKVYEYKEALGAEVLCCRESLNLPVERVVVGAMTMESALSYLRRAPRKAVVTGGDRSDICLAALETDTSVLILTGGLYPEVQILARAEELGVPVLLVTSDTYSAVAKINSVVRRICPHDKDAQEVARRSVLERIDIEELWQQL